MEKRQLVQQKICFDISSVGAPQNRWGGIARVVYEFLKQSTLDDDERLVFSATGALAAQMLAQQHLGTLGLSDQMIASRLGPLARLLIRLQDGDAQLLRVPAKQGLRVANRLRNPLQSNAVKELSFFFSFFAGVPQQIRRNHIPAGLFIHDLIPLLYPNHCSPEQIPIFRRILGSLRRGDLVVANSSCTKSDFCTYLNWDEEDVHVVSLGANAEIFRPVEDKALIQRVRAKYGIDQDRYFLSLHSLAPHKNMPILFKAYSLYAARHSETLPLVVAGGKGASRESLSSAFRLREDTLNGIQVIGYVDESDLASLYSGAQAFFFPSLYEGFGLPVIEAMFCGTPVFASNRASLSELIEEQSRLIDAEDVEAWAAAFERAHEEDGRLSPAEIATLNKKYDWNSAYRGLLGCIEAHLETRSLR